MRRGQRWPFRIVGLTGSIAMGKTTAALLLRALGIPVIDADAAVHGLLSPGGKAVAAVASRFPGVKTRQGGIDRKTLGARVFGNPKALAKLEAILHPLVQQKRKGQLLHAANQRRSLVVLDVPLLFETGGDHACDAVMVVTAPAFLQRKRAMARPGMTQARLAAILARQMKDSDKRRRADAVIPSGLGKREALHRLARFLKLGPRRSRRSLHRLSLHA